MECPKCGEPYQKRDILCDCGTRLDCAGLSSGELKYSVVRLWNSLRNWGRLRDAWSEKANRVREIENTLEDLAELPPERISSVLPVDRERVQRCIEVNQTVRSYRAWLRMRDSGADPWGVEVWMTVAPGKLHAFQRINNDGDEWVTVGDEHYRNAGLWFRIDDPQSSPMTYRFPMNLGYFVNLLQDCGELTAADFEWEKGSGIQFSFRIGIHGLEELGLLSVQIWMDASTRFIVKARMTASAEKGTETEMMFTSHNDSISIWRPVVNVGPDGVILPGNIEAIPLWGIAAAAPR